MQPYLYNIINSQKLKEILKCFYSCLELPIQALDESGNTLCGFGTAAPFCLQFKKLLADSPTHKNICRELHTKASRRAMDLGESYIFCCHANLNHIIFPLVNKDALYGAILVGPFLLEEPDSMMMLDIAKRYSFSTEMTLELYESVNSVQIITPEKATQISRLLSYTFKHLIPAVTLQMDESRSKIVQQSRINESIQMYKSIESIEEYTYPIEKEKLLIRKVREGNIPESRKILNELLGYVLFKSGSNLDNIRSRSIELCSLLSRAAMDGGANKDVALKISNNFLLEINSTRSQEELCLQLQKTVEFFIESMFIETSANNRSIIKTAIQYITQNYNTQLTLEETARHVHLNPSYFSTLFKQSCGSSFKEYLNHIRIEESKNLLTNTNYPIIDIAIAVGFENQSYFTKVFKRYTGLTPKQFRN